MNKFLRNNFNFFLQSYLKKINTFHNIHKNKKCYIFGDGYSIKYFDLKNFSNYISFTCGKMYLHKDFSKLKNKYIVSCDPFWLTPFFLTLKNKYGDDPHSKENKFLKYEPLTSNLKKFILKNNDINFFIDLSNLPFTYKNHNITHLSNGAKNNKFNSLFSSLNCDNYFGQTLPTSIILAIYMGFSDIYLVGCDYTHFPSRSIHWFEKGNPVISYGRHDNYLKDFFDKVKNIVNITTITLDGKAKNLNYLTYEEYTNAKINFKENHILLNDKNLEDLSMAKWFGYRIK